MREKDNFTNKRKGPMSEQAGSPSAPISVIIPLKNWHESIFLALRSVLESTLDPQEVILVDDGSSDNVTEWLARKINQEKPWIQVIRLQTSGVGAGEARQIGIRAASKAWIAFLDSDDYWPPNYLKQRMSFAKEGLTFICGPYQYTKETGEKLTATKLKSNMVSRWRLLLSNPIANSSVVCSRLLILDSGGYSKLCARNDYATWLRLAWNKKEPIHYDLEGPVVLVTRRARSLSSNKAKMIAFNFKAFREAGFSKGAAVALTLLNGASFAIKYLRTQLHLVSI